MRKAFVVASLVLGISLHPEFGFSQIGQKIKTTSNLGITGLWRNSTMGFNMDLTLKPDGKGMFDEENITFEFTANTLVIKSGGNKTTYQCKLNGNTLTLSGGDLDAPLSFNRITENGGVAVPSGMSSGTQPVNPPASTIIGTWVAPNEELSFTTDGKFVYNGVPLGYSLQGTQINVSAPAGNMVFQYALNGNTLSLKSDGLNAVYTRKGNSGGSGTGVAGQPGAMQQPDATGGVIEPALVGKWSYVGSANNPSGTFSTEEYITLNADGTYEYYSESSGTASGSDMYGNQTFAGGMASQSADRGTWRVKGNTIIANSQKTGVKTYQLQKKNHPKNGDPMIVLDGTAYVTYYQKPPWR